MCDIQLIFIAIDCASCYRKLGPKCTPPFFWYDFRHQRLLLGFVSQVRRPWNKGDRRVLSPNTILIYRSFVKSEQ